MALSCLLFQDDIELLILLPPSPKFWLYQCVPSHSALCVSWPVLFLPWWGQAAFLLLFHMYKRCCILEWTPRDKEFFSYQQKLVSRKVLRLLTLNQRGDVELCFLSVSGFWSNSKASDGTNPDYFWNRYGNQSVFESFDDNKNISRGIAWLSCPAPHSSPRGMTGGSPRWS